jgi:hypothetical protein
VSEGRRELPRREKAKKESGLVAFREWLTTGTGIAALIVAIIGLVIGSAAAGGKLFSTSPKPAHSGSSGNNSTPTSPPPPPSPAVRSTGPVRVDSVQLDTIPPQSGAGGGGDVGFGEQNSDPGIHPILSTKIALWTGAGEPDANQCTSLVERLGVSEFASNDGFIPVKQGSIVCVITDEGRTARLEVTEATNADAAAGFVLANATVWQ